MIPTSSESDSALPEALAQFEQELLQTSDPGALVEHFGRRFPELSETFRKMAEAMELLRATSLRDAGEARPAHDAPPHPKRFGPYRVVRSIGQGGMGEVYEAIEEPLGRHVAIKTLRRQATSENLLLRFDRERRTLARLHHTNVVPIYATGSEGDLLYFAMPYLSGASLGQVIKTARSHELSGNGLAGSTFEALVNEAHSKSQSASDNREAPGPTNPEPAAPTIPSPPTTFPSPATHHLSKAYIRTAVQVMATVAEGLHHAHCAGVIHRDLKPANIIVEADGHAWVLDFGLAALKASPASGPVAFEVPLPHPESDDALTVGPVGTLLYMAPEQHIDGKHADDRSDVWSLGVTLYELLTLKRAFSTKQAVLESEPTPPRQLTPALDRELEAVILRTLRKDPSGRYPTAQALADDLNHWLKREPVSVWPTHRLARPAWRVWLWSKRNKGWAAAIVLGLLVLLTLGVYAEAQREHAVEREEAKDRQLQLLDIQRIAQSDHFHGWSRRIWDRISGLSWKPEERGAVQAQAVASLSGLDTRTDKELRIFAQSLAFAPDGRLWLGHTGDGAKRWNPETDRLDTWPLELGGPLAIRPDGTVWQLGPTYTKPDSPEWTPHEPRPNPLFPLQLLDVERQVISRTLPDPVEGGSRLLTWTLAPKGSHAAAEIIDRQGRQRMLVWDALTGKFLHNIACPNAPESPALPGPGLAFAPDASLVATWDGSGRVDFWNIMDGKQVATFTARNPVHCVAFGPNLWQREAPGSLPGRWMVAVGDAHGLITLWIPGSQGDWQLLRSPGLDVFCLAFNPEGTLLASAGRTQVNQVWDVATGRRLLEFETKDYTTALAFSPDGTRLASSLWYPFEREPGLRPNTYMFALETGRGIQLLRGLPGTVAKVAFSRDGKRIGALSWDWWAGVWNRDTGRLLRMLAVPRGLLADNADLCFSPDGRRLVVSAGNTATLWDLDTGQSHPWTLPWGMTEAIAFSEPDHLFLMRAEVRDGSRPRDAGAPTAKYPRVCVLRDLLGPTPLKPVKVITDLNRGIKRIQASPDGTYFVVEGVSSSTGKEPRNVLSVYRTQGDLPPTQIATHGRPEDASERLPLDPTGRVLVHETQPSSRSLQLLLEMPSGRLLGTVPIPDAIGVAPGARLWAGASPADSHIQIYDDSGKPLVEQLSEPTSSVNLVFSPDLEGRFVLWGNPSGTVSVADLVEIRRRLTGVGLGW